MSQPSETTSRPSVDESTSHPRIVAGGIREDARRARIARRWAVFRAGIRDGSPAYMGTLVWGVVTGIAMMKAGLAQWQALLITFTVFAGSLQLATLPLIATGAPIPLIWLTGLLANLRFVIYTASMSRWLRRLPLRLKIPLGYGTGDSGVAYFMDKVSVRERERLQGRANGPFDSIPYFAGLNIMNFVIWEIASIVGIIASRWIPGGGRMSFIALIAIAAMLGPMLRNLAAWVAMLSATLVALLLNQLPWRAGMICAIVVAVVLAVVADRLAAASRRRAQRAGANGGTEPGGKEPGGTGPGSTEP